MMGILGIAVLVGLGASGFALYSGMSILMVLGIYMLAGWAVILSAIIVVFTLRSLRPQAQKQDHAYTG